MGGEHCDCKTYPTGSDPLCRLHGRPPVGVQVNPISESPGEPPPIGGTPMRVLAGLTYRLAGPCEICGVEVWLHEDEQRVPLVHLKPCRKRYYTALRRLR